MRVKSYQPSDPLLKKYIECIYTFRREADEEVLKYIAFPSIFSMICLNTWCSVEVEGTNLLYTASPLYPLQSKLIRDYKNSSWIRYEGATDEIVIYFKPLGINAFVETVPENPANTVITEFDPFEGYRDAISDIFAIPDDEARVEAVEKYWVSKFRGFEHPFLHSLIDEMLADPGGFSISEAVARHNITRTTLNKHFNQYIGTSPSHFRKIMRFRDAMKRHRLGLDGKNLTGISHGAEYFDQSHMVKDFKALTRLTPKSFFSKLSVIEDGKINWQFLPPA